MADLIAPPTEVTWCRVFATPSINRAVLSGSVDGNNNMRLFRIRTRRAPGRVGYNEGKGSGFCGVGKCWLATGFAIQVNLSGGAR